MKFPATPVVWKLIWALLPRVAPALPLLCGLFFLNAHGVNQAPKEPHFVPPPREIFPIPRYVEYRDFTIPFFVDGGYSAVFLADPEIAGKVNMIASDFNAALRERFGVTRDIPLQIGPSKDRLTLEISLHLLPNIPRDLSNALLTGRFQWGHIPQNKREQAFIIKYDTLPNGGYRVHLIGQSLQSLYYASMSLVTLVRKEKNALTLRPAEVVDWPAFNARMTAAAKNVNGEKSVELQHAVIRKVAGLTRINYGAYGYSMDAGYGKDRWLRLGLGYWRWMKGGPKDIPKGITNFNWSQPEMLALYESHTAKDAAGAGGLFLWHDVTDAGWFSTYLDKFWNKRDAVDRKNYPDEPSPAKADAIRFKKMMDVIVTSSNDTHVMLTVPCYYDNPQNDSLPHIGLFREYLQDLGSAIPEAIKDRFWFILEDRSPEAAKAYQLYLGARVLNYKYTTMWSGNTWDTQFTSAKTNADAGLDAFYWDTYNGHCDVATLCASQYLWNPDLPTDSKWVSESLLPRAAQMAYGDAWPDIAMAVLSSLDASATAKEFGVEKLNEIIQKAQDASNHCEKALSLIPESWLDARHGAKALQAHLKKIEAQAKQNLEKASHSLPLDRAKIAVSMTISGSPESIVTGSGLWKSDLSNGPQWLELSLDASYVISQIRMATPGDGGYSLEDVEVFFMVAEQWISVVRKRSNAFDKIWTTACPETRTDRVKIVFHKVADWWKKPIYHLVVNKIEMFGIRTVPDAPGTMRLDGKWWFKLDPNNMGERSGWQESKAFENWASIPVPCRWEASGVPGTETFDGRSWYARSFNLPASWRGRALKIRLDGVDDEVSIYVNGKKVGFHGKKGDSDKTWWEEPFSFDISDTLYWDKPNTVVASVDDLGGGGGIWKSVFIGWADGPGMVNIPDTTSK